MESLGQYTSKNNQFLYRMEILGQYTSKNNQFLYRMEILGQYTSKKKTSSLSHGISCSIYVEKQLSDAKTRSILRMQRPPMTRFFCFCFFGYVVWWLFPRVGGLGKMFDIHSPPALFFFLSFLSGD